ncbi:MAG: hypothetical protein WBZ36_03035 [Candidatus Nitrosopolaris sp.]
MIDKEGTIALSTVAIAAVIVLFATGPLAATHQTQARLGFEADPSTGNPHAAAPPGFASLNQQEIHINSLLVAEIHMDRIT